jgi:hypothetical protein
VHIIRSEEVKMIQLEAVYMPVCMKMENVPRREHSSTIAAHNRRVMLLVLLIVFDCDSHTKGIMRWAGHVECTEEERGVHRVLVGKHEGKSRLGRPDVDGRILLRWIFRKLEGVVGTGWIWFRIEKVDGQL